MTNDYTFSSIEIEDLLHNHAYEVAEILAQTYEDIENEIKNVGDNNA